MKNYISSRTVNTYKKKIQEVLSLNKCFQILQFKFFNSITLGLGSQISYSFVTTTNIRNGLKKNYVR